MNELIEQLRTIVPSGNNSRWLQFHNQYADAGFLNECIKDVEHLGVRIALGEKPTALERLGLDILFNTAGVYPKEWLENEKA